MVKLERLTGLEFFLGACAATRGFWTFAVGIQTGVPGQDAIVATLMLIFGILRMGVIIASPMSYRVRSWCALVLGAVWLYVGFDALLKDYWYIGLVPLNAMMASGSLWIYIALQAQMRAARKKGPVD